MKICAGLGRTDDYPLFAEAGADEVFCGYVPASWYDDYGMASPLNRREVRYAHVQLGSRSELQILSAMKQRFGIPVSLTFNSLSYQPCQYARILGIMEDCLADGFDRFIVADPALLTYLSQHGLYEKARITVSGELGEMNPPLVKRLVDLGVSRIIFHRKMGFADMAACIRAARGADLDFEAFVLNEKCHFHGGFCNSLHCDELPALCNLPYRVTGMDAPAFFPAAGPVAYDGPGSTGCGLCALFDLQNLGITHLKLVGRGNHTDAMLRDLRLLRACVDALASCTDRDAFSAFIRQQFPEGCAHNCYYPDSACM